ncbi:alpha/beta fold hydrolase [Candidatus Contubernalis alkaliaceticus]|uniref:alpha/beta fold hydrolase n=1 Tax=Candidatus Contubernalis alkaliaceticus TaxID=338645 RepID=UPI001F4BF8F7|nr:alpha/beta hydrolase [Candidatus Contubernalis alkalaceticus]UNC91414.1 alpha/beta hydrolase [Candidatus Contubernalis alkalaceticus]
MKKAFSFLAKFVVVPAVLLLICVIVIFSLYTGYQRYQNVQAFGIDTPEGIQSLEQVTLGEVEQWISIRGHDQNNPVLLFLHGGPGSSVIPIVRHFNSGLEEYFVVVNWDQRGAGKSYNPDIPVDSMNIEQFVSDTLELTHLLQERFEQEKIYLMGHSWGTIIGTPAVQQQPELYHAFIGVGQAVNFKEGEKISYNYTLDAAYRLGDEKAIQQLEDIGPPPYLGDDFHNRIVVQRTWLQKFGGLDYTERNPTRSDINYVWLFLTAPEYSLGDTVNMLKGGQFSFRALWEQLHQFNYIEEIPRLEVPVYFLMGRHDYVTVFELVEEYYDKLEAPHKELIWFDNSAHSPNFEEPERFVEVVTQKILQDNQGG